MSNSIVPLNKEIGNNVVISFKNMKRQTFDFSYEIMEYILAKANFNLAKKLYFTCKYFPYKIRLFLIDNLEYCDGIVLTNLSKELEFQNTVNPADFNDRVWLGDTIMTDYDNIILWIPKIERCPIRGLKIVKGFLSWNEFKILTKDGKVERLCIEKVVDSDGNMIAIEDICACVPNLYELW
uniref:Uncharacterized protein n=1 Tax=Panagrolaimus davidi TaxID=227884 RepID=A0A914QUK5_9BILA